MGSGESATAQAPAASDGGFNVSLAEFSGPFDLLLNLIAKHKLDVTVLALAQVTDEYIAHIKAQGAGWDLDETTEFVLIAATLLDLKAARLLPSGEVSDEDDLELLEARDLLFARLLQYRAFKAVAGEFETMLGTAPRRYPRTVGLDPQFSVLLPDVVLGMGPAAFAEFAGAVLTPKLAPEVSTSHVHVAPVSVREQAELLVGELRRRGGATFRSLVANAENIHVIIARFLALLELYREGLVAFDQAAGLAELHIRWVGDDAAEVDVSDFDEQEGDDDRA